MAIKFDLAEIADIKERLNFIEKLSVKKNKVAIAQEVIELKQRIKVLESKYLKLKIS